MQENLRRIFTSWRWKRGALRNAASRGSLLLSGPTRKGERIPLTICDYDREKGTVTIVFQTVGAGTQKMAHLKAGDYFHDFVGPLGCESELVNEPEEELKKKSIMRAIPLVLLL